MWAFIKKLTDLIVNKLPANKTPAVITEQQTDMLQNEEQKLPPLSEQEWLAIIEVKDARILELEALVYGDKKPVKIEVKKPIKPSELVPYGGKNYKWKLSAFIFEGKRYTAEEASCDQDVIGRILSLPGQGLLKEIQ
jgi:hypothetical protein